VSLSTNANQIGSFQGGIQDPKVIADWLFCLIVNTGSVNTTFMPMAIMKKLTDSNGHGLLVATDQLFMNVDTQNTAQKTFSAVARVGYRFKDVGLTEYIGIVQSQQ
jgi:hypothetical protein